MSKLAEIQIHREMFDLLADGTEISSIIDEIAAAKSELDEEAQRLIALIEETTGDKIENLLNLRQIVKTHIKIEKMLARAKVLLAKLTESESHVVDVFDWIENTNHYYEWHADRKKSIKNREYYRYMDFLYLNMRPGEYTVVRLEDGSRRIVPGGNIGSQ